MLAFGVDVDMLLFESLVGTEEGPKSCLILFHRTSDYLYSTN